MSGNGNKGVPPRTKRHKKMPKWGTKKNEALAFLAKTRRSVLGKLASAVARAANAPGGGGGGEGRRYGLTRSNSCSVL